MLWDGRMDKLPDVAGPETPAVEGKNHRIVVKIGDDWLSDEVVAIIG